MKWRIIDNMITSACIQRIQKDINEGKMKATDFVMVQDEKQAAELFNAWRVYLIDRMGEEHDKQGWADNNANPMAELEYDVEYYKKLKREEGIK